MDMASHLRSATWHVGRAAMLAKPGDKAPYTAMTRELAGDIMGGGDTPKKDTTPFLRKLLLDAVPGTMVWDPDTQQIKTERVFASLTALQRQLRDTPTTDVRWSALVNALEFSIAHQEKLDAELEMLRGHVSPHTRD